MGIKKFFCVLLLTSFYKAAIAQTSELKGRIMDEQTGKPLPGATIAIKSSSISRTTNNEGYYSLSTLTAGKIILIISYVGYEAKELSVNIEEGNRNVMDVVLSATY